MTRSSPPESGGEAATNPRRPSVSAFELAALVALAAAVFAAAARQIAAVDVWWQLATGAYVLDHGFPTTDVFSYVSADRPWVELRWLYCTVLFAVFDGFGAAGAVLLKVGLVLATFAVAIGVSVRRRTMVPAMAVGFLALLAMTSRMQLRPEVVSGFFVMVYVALIQRERHRGGGWVFALPFLQVVWTNCHPVSILGPALVGAWLVTELGGRFVGFGRTDPERDGLARSAIVLGGVFLAALVNPWFLEGALFPLQLLAQTRTSEYADTITELLSPFVIGTGISHAAYVALLVTVVVSGLLAFRRVDAFLAIVTVAFAWLSISAIRNVPLFVVIAIPFVVSALRETPWLFDERFEKLRHRAHLATCGVLVVAGLATTWLLVTDRFTRVENSKFGFGVLETLPPEAAVDFLESRGIIGERIFNYLDEGSYLLWRGYPVFFDPRLEVHGEEPLLEYRRAGASPAAFQKTVERYDFPVVMLAIEGNVDDMRSKVDFVNGLVAEGSWRLVYLDHRVFTLLRSGFHPEVPALADVPEAEWLDRWRALLPDVASQGSDGRSGAPSPFLYGRLGMAARLFGLETAATAMFRDAVALDPDFGFAWQNLADLALRRNDFEEAADGYAKAAASLEPAAARVAAGRRALAVGLGKIDAGRPAQALPDFETAYRLTGDEGIRRQVERLRASLAGGQAGNPAPGGRGGGGR